MANEGQPENTVAVSYISLGAGKVAKLATYVENRRRRRRSGGPMSSIDGKMQEPSNRHRAHNLCRRSLKKIIFKSIYIHVYPCIGESMHNVIH